MFRVAALLVSLFLALSTTAHADSFGLKVQPSVTSLQINPANSTSTTYTLTNTTDETLTLIPQLYEFRPSEKGDGSISLTSPRNLTLTKPSIAQYFTFAQGGSSAQTINIPPHDTTTLTLSINIPENAVQEDIYTTVLFSPQVPSSEGTSITGAVGSNLILTIGTPSPSLEIIEFNTGGSIFGGNRSFTLTVQNSGKSQTTTQAHITVYNLLGRKVGELTTDTLTVLSQSSRKMTLNGNSDLGWEKGITLGRYTAAVTLKGEESIQESLSFVEIPAIPIIVLIICLSFIIGVYLRVKRKI